MKKTKRTKKEDKYQSQYEYKECGIDFGSSLGDVELHKLTRHLQNGDINIE